MAGEPEPSPQAVKSHLKTENTWMSVLGLRSPWKEGRTKGSGWRSRSVFSLGAQWHRVFITEAGESRGKAHSGRWPDFAHGELKHMQTGLSFKYPQQAVGYLTISFIRENGARTADWKPVADVSLGMGEIIKLKSPNKADKGMVCTAVTDDCLWDRRAKPGSAEGAAKVTWWQGSPAREFQTGRW